MDSMNSSYGVNGTEPSNREIRRITPALAVSMVIVTTLMLASVFAMIQVGLNAGSSWPIPLRSWYWIVMLWAVVDALLLFKIRNPSRRP